MIKEITCSENFFDRYELCMNPGAIIAASGVQKALINFSGAPGCNTLASMVRTEQLIDGSYAKIVNWAMGEHDVIYGGIEKSRKALEYELDRRRKAYDIAFIMTACPTSLIGDDIYHLADSLEKKYGLPVIACDVPGFKGTYVDGADLVYAELVKKLAKDMAPQKGFVNIIGPHIGGSKNWKNDLEEIKRLLMGLGLTVNCVLTNDTPLSAIKQFLKAEANITLSLEELPRFKKICLEKGIRTIGQRILPPYGSLNTEQWLYSIAEELGIPKEKADDIMRHDYKRVQRIIGGNYNSSWVLQGLLGRTVAIISPATFTTALARSLYYDFHIIPKVLALYYTSEEAYRIAKGFLQDMDIILMNNPNRSQLAEQVMKEEVDFVIGMRVERQLFESLGITHLPLAGLYFYNQFNFVPWPYAGIRGILNLISELATLFNNYVEDQAKWHYYPYFPVFPVKNNNVEKK